MKIKILYFARLKEALKFSSEDLTLNIEAYSGKLTVRKLKEHLAQRSETWQKMLLGDLQVRGAVNHTLVDDDAQINDGDEVAFFPPVTGG